MNCKTPRLNLAKVLNYGRSFYGEFRCDMDEFGIVSRIGWQKTNGFSKMDKIVTHGCNLKASRENILLKNIYRVNNNTSSFRL